MKYAIAAVTGIFLIFSTVTLFPDNENPIEEGKISGESNPLAEISEMAQEKNLEILKAERAVQDAREDLIEEKRWRDSVFSIEGGYSYGTSSFRPSSAFASNDWFGTLGIDYPLLDQLSIGSDLSVLDDGRINESISVTYTPFEKADEMYTEAKALNQALVRRRYLRQNVFYQAEQAILNVMIREKEKMLAAETLELEEKKYEVIQKQQDIGDASFQDVQDQLVTVIESRQNLFDTELQYLNDWKNLRLIFAPSEEELSVEHISFEELLSLVGQRSGFIGRVEGADPGSETLENLNHELTALRAELEDTPIWQPTLTLSASGGIPDPSYSVRLIFSFSPNQIDEDEIEDLKRDIAEKQLDIRTEAFNMKLQKDLLLQRIAIAEQALEAAEIQLENDRISLREAELLFERGRRTSLELEQIRLNVVRSEIQSFIAAVNVYKSQADYLMLFVSEE